MWNIAALLLLSALSIAQQPEGSNSKVCYEHVGCFDNSSPFEKPQGKLPKSPEEIDVKLKLYTPHNPGTPYYLNYTDARSVKSSNFDAKLPLKVIIHGFMSNAKGNWVTRMKNEILKKEDTNVVDVDWSKGTNDVLDYHQSVANTRLVAVEINMLIDLFVAEGMPVKNVHLIGHSLGAHLAGYVGYLQGSKIGRITALDPAEWDYTDVPLAARVDPTDALFVDAIHTDGGNFTTLGAEGGLGLFDAVGHVDFYVNGGKEQPGCKTAIDTVVDSIWDIFGRRKRGFADTLACNHVRSHKLFTDSINSPCLYETFPCENYEEFLKGECTSCGATGCGVLGYSAQAAGGRGKQYIETLGKKPYCGYQYKVVVNLESTQGLETSHGELQISFGQQNGELTSHGIIKASDAKIENSAYEGVIIIDKHVDPIVALIAHFKQNKGSATTSFVIKNIQITDLKTHKRHKTVTGSFEAGGKKIATLYIESPVSVFG